ncbi:MAG TPA: aromatic-ring-hydroxylating dioxygenase subunit beta [Burkholderiales bacterium]
MKRVTEKDLVKFVVQEARLLDEKRFDEWYDLFADDGFYWVPAVYGQKDAHLENSLAYEDKFLLKLRVERLKTPNAFSQQPASRCHHLLQTPAVENLREMKLRTAFIYTETRGDESQRYAATAWHTLVQKKGALRIKLKRVDLLNCDAMLPSIQLFP